MSARLVEPPSPASPAVSLSAAGPSPSADREPATYSVIDSSAPHPTQRSHQLPRIRANMHARRPPMADAARPRGDSRLAHVRVAVVDRRHQRLFDGPRVDPPDQVEDRPGLVVGTARPGAAERLLPDNSPGRLVIDVEIASREPERLGGGRDRCPVLG